MKKNYTPQEIGKAIARQISSKWGPFDRDTYLDLIQDATEGAIVGRQKSDKKGYQFKSAYTHALGGLWRMVWGGKGSSLSIDDMDIEFSASDGENSPFVSQEQLVELFLDMRSKKGKRGREAAERDAYICFRLLQGANNASLSTELGIPEHDVRHYRSELKKRLA